MTDVFISYASEDRERARKLAGELEARGWSVWWDRKISAGQIFDEVIERELGTAKSVVVLWSKHSVSSEWVRNEAAAAAERNVLVPVLMDSVKLPLEFRRRQTLNLIGWDSDPSHVGFQALCGSISTNIIGVATPQSNTLSPFRFHWNRRWVLASLAAVAISLLFGAYIAGLLDNEPPLSVRQVSVDGVWRHHSGVIWVIKQNERLISLEQILPNEGVTVTGTGILTGTDLRLDFLYTSGGGRATGQFTVAADGRTISGEYTDLGSGAVKALIFRR